MQQNTVTLDSLRSKIYSRSKAVTKVTANFGVTALAKELLKDITIRNTKAEPKDYRLNDGNSLYLIIKATGAKWWRFDYTFKVSTLNSMESPTSSLHGLRFLSN